MNEIPRYPLEEKVEVSPSRIAENESQKDTSASSANVSTGVDAVVDAGGGGAGADSIGDRVGEDHEDDEEEDEEIDVSECSLFVGDLARIIQEVRVGCDYEYAFLMKIPKL